MSSQRYDVAIIGGGPAGSTVGSLLKKYAPDSRVVILEREQFPRDHVGESQLPLIGEFLHEMGAWDKVEAAGFPIKVGATYRWGSTPDLWHFNFLPNGELLPEARPATYSGQRVQTAFQVDRAIYDEILLGHAGSLGCEVRQNTKVVRVGAEEDRVTELELDSGEQLSASWYVDASGASGLFRRAFGVEVDAPSNLRNIAIWDYWQNAAWAEEIGVGGTRVQVLSLGWGWIWFIPIGPTRTSIGLVAPASFYKASGLKPQQIYETALAEEPRVRSLLDGAVSESRLASTNDWSYVADRLTGGNWFLTGDSCGFADPILAAGMTLAHGSAREVAYVLTEALHSEARVDWLKQSYCEGHRRRIAQHIRFADYWYAANGCFQDLVDYTREIALHSGLSLSPRDAFQWLGTGGFANDDLAQASIGTYSVSAVKTLTRRFSSEEVAWEISRTNTFQLVQVGVSVEERPRYVDGQVQAVPSLRRGDRRLVLNGPFALVHRALQVHRSDRDVVRFLWQHAPGRDLAKEEAYLSCLHALEAMIAEGWVKASLDKKRDCVISLEVPSATSTIADA